MEIKTSKTRFKYEQLVYRVIFVQIFMSMFRIGECAYSIRDVHGSSQFHTNFSSNSHQLAEKRWRHSHRRKTDSGQSKSVRLHTFQMVSQAETDAKWRIDSDPLHNFTDYDELKTDKQKISNDNTETTYDFNAKHNKHENLVIDNNKDEKLDKSVKHESATIGTKPISEDTISISHQLTPEVDQNGASKVVNVPSDKRRSGSILRDIQYLRRHLNEGTVNFVMTDQLVDGEVETRIMFNGVTAKETSVGKNRTGLKLRQLTDGTHLVQIIYTPSQEIYDCEYVTQKKAVRSFLRTLRNEFKQALQEENQRLFESIDNPPVGVEDAYLRHFTNVTFRIVRNGDQLPTEVDWLDYEDLKMRCLQRHEQMQQLLQRRESGNRVSRVDAENSLSRARRSLRENFIIPGTKWCGAGQLADTWGELGTQRQEDKCCRAHDHCPKNILPFRRRFGVFNHRLYSISHCRCDRRFRACLKLADTSVSNMVGKLFFNVVQTKCFVLKPTKMCMQRSWWGKCLKKGYAKTAHLRNNMPY